MSSLFYFAFFRSDLQNAESSDNSNRLLEKFAQPTSRESKRKRRPTNFRRSGHIRCEKRHAASKPRSRRSTHRRLLLFAGPEAVHQPVERRDGRRRNLRSSVNRRGSDAPTNVFKTSRWSRRSLASAFSTGAWTTWSGSPFEVDEDRDGMFAGVGLGRHDSEHRQFARNKCVSL